jgi:hypothetical protein
MNQTNINYKSVLTDLLARRQRLDAAIAAIQEFVGADEVEANVATETPKVQIGISREYRGMTISAATIKFLRKVGEPQLTRAIADGLRLGGLGSNSKNMYRTVYNTLNNRLDKHQDIVKEGAKWGLAEWRKEGQQ